MAAIRAGRRIVAAWRRAQRWVSTCGHPGAGALAKIDANYALFATGFTPTPESGNAVRAHAQALKDALSVWRADHDYYNFLETPAEADVALPSASYQRLREIKARYDPDQAIISTHPARPTGR